MTLNKQKKDIPQNGRNYINQLHTNDSGMNVAVMGSPKNEAKRSRKPYRVDGGDISSDRIKEIANNPYGDEEKCWLAKRLLALLDELEVAEMVKESQTIERIDVDPFTQNDVIAPDGTKKPVAWALGWNAHCDAAATAIPNNTDSDKRYETESTIGIKQHFLAGYDAGHSRGFTCGRLYGEDSQVRSHRLVASETYLTELALAE